MTERKEQENLGICRPAGNEKQPVFNDSRKPIEIPNVARNAKSTGESDENGTHSSGSRRYPEEERKATVQRPVAASKSRYKRIHDGKFAFQCFYFFLKQNAFKKFKHSGELHCIGKPYIQIMSKPSHVG
ncbi:hypothetical protein Y032_0644g1077 [Ancylostoma ceylanicum]|uniref:Uncharacterized protein n=1 Tax=Ancylostoma ceylanicum TaxID=53326 RepID=A0A016WJ73_9BILA|nr:hypothetical protein Y032_0644g1077 [Ancylostoma ceylanicum]